MISLKTPFGIFLNDFTFYLFKNIFIILLLFLQISALIISGSK